MLDNERRAWLRLARTQNVGPVTFRNLISRFGTASATLEELPRLAARGGGMAHLLALGLDRHRLVFGLFPAFPSRELCGVGAAALASYLFHASR